MGSYTPHTSADQRAMLDAIGLEKLDDLYKDIPEQAKLAGELDLPAAQCEMAVEADIKQIASKNKIYKEIYRGAGAYNHYIPAAVGAVISNESSLTAYTPYQAEVSQGVLQAIFEYQTIICELTGLDVANASVYDGASACAEAVAMCKGRRQNKIFVSGALNPQYLKTVKTYCFGSGVEVAEIPVKDCKTDIDWLNANIDDQCCGVLLQQPNFFGAFEDAQEFGEAAHGKKAQFVLCVNPVSAAICKSAAEYGADIAVGDAQPLGLPLSFGGPYVGFMAATQKMMRKLPGRIVGQTTDVEGKRAYVLTLQAREQHIRREKASSNICSNQALCALAVGVHCSTLGQRGMQDVAKVSSCKAHRLAGKLEQIGFENLTPKFFNEFTTKCPVSPSKIEAELGKNDVLSGLPLENGQMLWCCTEKNSKDKMDAVVEILAQLVKSGD